MKLYDLQLEGSDGLMYGLRVLQTEEEVKQLQRVGIMGELWEITSIEQVPDILLKCLGNGAK
jgi:hypothetical protein